ncbi:MAG: hypothetical protein Q9224_006984, partial [Gallowayella concinna]
MLLSIIPVINAAAARRPHQVLPADIVPICFPTRPHCIRPRVEECREAIDLMHTVDPGYPITVGRSEITEHIPHAFIVPRIWSSVPVNCIVKID